MDSLDQERIADFRTRLLSRLRGPCRGRFDPCWDIEAEFSQFRQEYRLFLNELLVSQTEEFEQHTIVALLEELDWAVRTIEGAWKKQDHSIKMSCIPNPRRTVSQRKRPVDPSQNQRTLDSFS